MGIGTASPGSVVKFTVNGSTRLNSTVFLDGSLKLLKKDGSDHLNFAARNTSGSEAVFDLSNIGTLTTSGNVGIGTTSPYAKLSVVGETVSSYFTATTTTATSTFAGGLDLTSSTGNGLNFGSNTLFYQNNQRFLTSSTTAAGNLTIGYQTATGLDANGGLYNTGVGYQALGNATSTGYNTALGYQALKGSATISNTGQNTAVGYQALMANTSGWANTATGYKALVNNTTGTLNTAYGYQTLHNNSTGGSNNAFGYQALYYDTGSSNNAFGNWSLFQTTSGSSNNAFGWQSLFSNTTGNSNTVFGHNTFHYNTTGAGNIGLGYLSGGGANSPADQRSVIDDYMTFIGYQASRDASIASTTALTNGTAIGKNARVALSKLHRLRRHGSGCGQCGDRHHLALAHPLRYRHSRLLQRLIRHHHQRLRFVH